MTGTVETLRLSGLAETEALQAVNRLLGDRSRGDLSRLLVLDDTAALTDHSEIFERLLTSRRMDHLLCVAVGPRAGDTRELLLPGSISGGRGSAVLWVSDPLGVDWQLAASAIAKVRSGNGANGLNYLIDLLSTAEVFDRVCELAALIPGGIASPGLRLAGTDDEAASFSAALAVAIRRLVGSRSPSPGTDEPFTIQPNGRPGASLAENGEICQYRDDVGASATSAAAALAELATVGGLVGFSQPQAPELLIATGTALAMFRDRVSGLLRSAHAPGGLSEKQLDQVVRAGVRLPELPGIAEDGTRAAVPRAGSVTTAVRDAIAEDVRSGATLPRVSSRLALTERKLDPRGSASYLPDVDRCCPAALIRRLAEPGPLPPPHPLLPAAGALAAVLAGLAAGWSIAAGIAAGVIIALGWTGITVLMMRGGQVTRPAVRRRATAALLAALVGAAIGAGAGVALKPARPVVIAGIVLALVIVAATAIWSWRARVGAWRRDLAPNEATGAAGALAELVVTVATREWSGAAAMLDEIARSRIVIDGVAQQLRVHADHYDGVESTGLQASRAVRLSNSLTPTLRELVLAVLAARPAFGLDGRAAFELAQAKTGELITGWTLHARENGALSPPPFAAMAGNGTSYADESEVAEIKEIVAHDPSAVMWQLCTPADLSALDVVTRPQVVAFAPRLARQPLADALPRDTVWTSSGQHAGLLRLVPLRAGIARPKWSGEDEQELLP
jgi:hypothetical protein